MSNNTEKTEKTIRLYKGMIFDMDGTLINSEIRHHEAWRKAAALYGFPYLSSELLFSFAGMPTPEIVKGLNEKYGLNAPVDELSAAKTGFYRDEEMQKVEIFDYTCTLLKELHAEGHRIALATSSHREETSYLLERHGLLPFIDAVITGDMIEHGKPAPDIFLTAAAALNLKPAECLVFEDSDTGMLCAKNAKIDAIRVAEGAFVTGEPEKNSQ